MTTLDRANAETPNGPVSIEICVDSAASALAAERGGAARVELCANLWEGGVTPSAGLIELVRSTSIGLHVMIRPRSGDFCYTAEEFEIMQHDILVARKLEADGVVLGLLNPDGSIDVERTRRLVDLARPMNVTFHRAFDMSADLFRALEDICSVGADRLLTSGAQPTALEGASTIATIVKAAHSRIAIMAGGGVRQHNVARIMEQTGVREIHASLKNSIASPMIDRNPRITLAATPANECQNFQVLEEDVRNLRRAAAGPA